MTHRSSPHVRGMLIGVVVVLGVAYLSALVVAQRPQPAPTFHRDLSWPKPLPNNWVIGMVASLNVDARDHVWIIYRPNSVRKEALAGGKKMAPPVIEFDQDGKVVQAWGGPGPGYDWMEENLEDYPRGVSQPTRSSSFSTCSAAARFISFGEATWRCSDHFPLEERTESESIRKEICTRPAARCRRSTPRAAIKNSLRTESCSTGVPRPFSVGPTPSVPPRCDAWQETR